MVMLTFLPLQVCSNVPLLSLFPIEKAQVKVVGQGWLAERIPSPCSSHKWGSKMQWVPSLPPSATIATPPSSPATAFPPSLSPSLDRGILLPSHKLLQGTPSRTLQLICQLWGVPHEQPSPTNSCVHVCQPVQRPRAESQHATTRHHVPPGEALAEEAKVTTGRAAACCCAQPAAAYQGKQGDQYWDHWGGHSHRTFLKRDTHACTIW